MIYLEAMPLRSPGIASYHFIHYRLTSVLPL